MPRRQVAGAALAALALVFSPALPTAQGAPRDLPRVRFVAAPGSSVEVFGRYPKFRSSCRRPVQPLLRARFPGTIEIGKDREGRLFVIGVLPFERYLEGLAEVPRRWPMEALKAQVVAARSYALAHYNQPSEEGAELGYDLCATPACQVYAGMAVSHGPYGDRWRKAVSATSGQVLLYQGRPAETVYSSTSNGRTYGNDKVFGSDPLPYLRPVRERDDAVSPLSRWRVRIGLADLRRFLHAGRHWPKRPIASVRQRGSNVVISGGGVTKKMDIDDFRSSVNFWAPCLEPNGYPTYDQGTRLPQTIPSHWFRAKTTGSTISIAGRGWGHGVGMVQWGAYGKAKRGLSYRQILAYYYGGLSPRPFPGPSVIRIGIAVGLRAVRVEGTGDVRLTGARRPSGPWLVTGGKRLRVRHGAAPPTRIRAGSVLHAPERVRAGRAFQIRLFVPQLSVLKVVLEGNGTRLTASPEATVEAGTARIRGRVPDGTTSGTYSLRAVLGDGVDLVATNPRPIRIRGERPVVEQPTTTAAPPPKPRTEARGDRSAPSTSVVGVLVIAVLVLGAVLAAWFFLRELRRPRP